MKRQTAFRNTQINEIPHELIGDWTFQGLTFRFNYDGNFFWVITSPYTILNNQTFYFENDVCERMAGTTGLIGVWRASFDDNIFLDYIFGRHNFYAFEWSDGIKGSGYYASTEAELTIVEQRARFSCSGNNFVFVYADGIDRPGTFSIVGNKLTISLIGETPVEYTKLPF